MENTATIKLCKVSEKILIKKSITQGDAISPKLVSVVINIYFFVNNSEWEEVENEINGK